jgi:hypothetical protein
MHKGYDIQGAYNAHVVVLKDLMGINHNPTRTSYDFNYILFLHLEAHSPY